MKSIEIRNELGVYDNDMLNKACETERKEELAEKIAHAIVVEHGYNKGLYNGHIFSFPKICNILKDYGFLLQCSNDEDEEHLFVNTETGDKISIYPKTYYPNQGAMVFDNFILS